MNALSSKGLFMSFKPGSLLRGLFAPVKASSVDSVPSESERLKNKDLNVISNPDSSEEDWLLAFQGLGDQIPTTVCRTDIKASTPNAQSCFKKLDRLALIALLFGIAACIALILFNPTFLITSKSLNTNNLCDHMVPLKERVGTSDPEVFRDKIFANWWAPKGCKDGHAVIKFDVRSDGSFKNMQIESRPVSRSHDSSAVDAVLSSGPFFCQTQRTDKLPSVKVHFDDGKVTVETSCVGPHAVASLQEHFVPKHEDTASDHMAPLKKRIDTRDSDEVFRDKILANWKPIKGFKKGYTVLKFDVRRDGSFKDMQVEFSNTTVSQQNRAVDAVLSSGPFFLSTQRTDKFPSAKVYFDNGKVTVETFYPLIFNGLDSVHSTDVKYPELPEPDNGDHFIDSTVSHE
jgi:hypothetical protein